jgi:hypothetical protein
MKWSLSRLALVGAAVLFLFVLCRCNCTGVAISQFVRLWREVGYAERSDRQFFVALIFSSLHFFYCLAKLGVRSHYLGKYQNNP